VEPTIIKKIVSECYCKYVSENTNKDLYEELAELLGMYSYTKGKENIQPYIIIGKKLQNNLK
jgi:hypothetical protein